MSHSESNSNLLELLNAIKNKDKMTVQTWILNNATIDTSKVNIVMLLHWAIIQFDDLDIITMLLDRGADIHDATYCNKKPLETAILLKKTEAALLFIGRGALIGEDLNEFLFKAIQQKDAKLAKILIDKIIKFNPSVDLKTFLNDALFYKQPEIIEYILPHCQFLEPSDLYISEEVVKYSGPEYEECVQLLLKSNFILNPDSKHDKDFVYEAVENGHLPIFLQLVKMGIDVNMVHPDTGLSLLKVACLYEHHNIVENLLKHNASVNVTTPTNIKILNNLLHYNRNHPLSLIHDTNNLRDITCLHIAVLNSDPKMTKLLLENGATIIDDPTFFNITCIAVRKNCEEIVQIFLDRGVNINDTNPEGKSLLHFCVSTGADGKDHRYNIAKLLLEKGADINIQTPDNSFLFEAIKNRYYKVAQLFLDYNADVQYISQARDTLLHKAIENDFDVEFIKTLLKRNVPVNTVNKDMLTPFHVACQVKSVNQLEIIKTLLDYNANVNCTIDGVYVVSTADLEDLNDDILIYDIVDKGQTPLHLICKYKNDMTASIIQLLLQHNANIEAVDAKGWTPLSVACKTNNVIAVKCLLDNHANANHMDLERLTPLYIAAENCEEDSEIIKILLEHKVNVHCWNKLGESVIHVIVEKELEKEKDDEVIKSFANTQINFNSLNEDGDTPLHTAVRLQGAKMIQNLIKYGANINTLNEDNQTPLGVAVEYMSDFDQEFEEYDQNPSGNNIDLVDRYNVNIFKIIIKIFKIQIVKLRVAGLKVNNQNLKIFNNSNDIEVAENEFFDQIDDYKDINSIDISQIEVECEKELETIKSENFGVNNITFYDLLTKNIHHLSRFVKNKKLKQILELEMYDKKFPLYIDIIRSRFRDAKFRFRMLNAASKYFTIIITSRLPDDCIDTVFSYLNIKELKMLIRALKPLDR